MPYNKPTYEELENRIKELELLNAETLFQDLVETSQDLIWQCDADGRYTFLNSSWQQVLGYSLEEMLGKRFTDFQTPEQAALDLIEFERLMDGNTVKGLETIHIAKDGKEIFLVFNAKFLIDKNGKIAGTRGTAYDITNRKKAENALRESEERFRQLFQNLNSNFALHEIIVDEYGKACDYRFLEVNPGFEKATGIKAEDIIGKTALEMFPGTEKYWIEKFGEVAITGKPINYENYSKELNKYFEMNLYSPKKGRFAMIGNDITERKQVELALKERNLFIESLLKLNPDIIYIYDIIEQKNIFSNEGITNILGYSINEIREIGNKIMPYLMHPDDFGVYIEKILPQYAKVQDNEPISHQYRMKDKYGNWHWIESAEIIYLRQNDGTPHQIFGTGRDITERKQAEISLKETLSLTQATLESIHNGILAVSKNGKVLKFNARFAEMWHIPNDILALHNDNILLDHILNQLNEPEQFLKTVSELYSLPEAESNDLIYFKDGRIFERISKPMYVEGEPHGRVWSFLDISERLHTEKIIQQQNIDLKELIQTKDRFISILAHDLRSPFNAMLGFLDLLVKNIHTIEIDKVEAQINIINNSAIRVYNLLNDILLWAKAQSGKMQINSQQINLRNLTTQVFEALMVSADYKTITLNNYVSENTSVLADIEMLKTILRNIVSNAIKFTNSGGVITIKAEQSVDFTTISISDNGVGMDHEILSKLFVISPILPIEGTSKEKGVGFGLIVSKELVEKHGGKIWATSMAGKGSTFYFTIQNHTLK